MTLRVVIAAEEEEFDVEIYRVLLEMLLGRDVRRHAIEPRLRGDTYVISRVDPFLAAAQRDGVEHALLAIDNDGDDEQHPEHEADHDQTAHAAEKKGCRVCRLSAAIPGWWTDGGGRHCVVVPVQVIETWLLCLRGTPPFDGPDAERQHHRRTIKREFVGLGKPSAAGRLAMALHELKKADALVILRRRASFRHFEAQLAGW